MSATSAAAKGATYLIGLQVLSRALTFVLNQILLRFLGLDTLGRAAQLEVYSISVLFFARESLRTATQRVDVFNPRSLETGSRPEDVGKSSNNNDDSSLSKDGKTESSAGRGVQTVVNLSYLSLLLGLPLTLFLGSLCRRAMRASQTTSPQTAIVGSLDQTMLAVALYGLAALLELASEPGFGAAQTLLLFKVRAGAEATATVAKTFATVGTALVCYYYKIDAGVLPFAVGQLSFATLLLLYYAVTLRPIASTHQFDLVPARMQSVNVNDYIAGYFSTPLLKLAASLTAQSGLKYVLTQGDSLLIATFASLRDQGIYALASNYGGLIARMLFQPIEEASRALFAKLCASSLPSSDEKTTTKNRKAEPQPGVLRATHLLRLLLNLYALLSLPALTLAPSLAPPLLTLIAGPKLASSGAGTVLGTYGYYIPLLAANGVLEAFVSATASNADLHWQSFWMAGFFALFAGSAWVMVGRWGWGAEGVVYANCVNMAARIVWAVGYVGRYCRVRGVEFDVLGVMPGAGSLGVAVGVPFALRATEGILGQYGTLGELVRVGAVAVALVAAIGILERRFLGECYALFRQGSG